MLTGWSAAVKTRAVAIDSSFLIFEIAIFRWAESLDQIAHLANPGCSLEPPGCSPSAKIVVCTAMPGHGHRGPRMLRQCFQGRRYHRAREQERFAPGPAPSLAVFSWRTAALGMTVPPRRAVWILQPALTKQVHGRALRQIFPYCPDPGMQASGYPRPGSLCR